MHMLSANESVAQGGGSQRYPDIFNMFKNLVQLRVCPVTKQILLVYRKDTSLPYNAVCQLYISGVKN